MDLETLRDELTLPQYTNETDVAVAAVLNAKNKSELRPISSAELLAWSGGNGRFGRIEKAATNADLPVNAQTVARVAHRLICRDNTELDLNLPDRMKMLDVLVDAKVLYPAEKADLLARATVKVSRAEQLRLGTVREGTVQQARAM